MQLGFRARWVLILTAGPKLAVLYRLQSVSHLSLVIFCLNLSAWFSVLDGVIH